MAREQKARLPDGIRDCRASHVLVEFKYTESVGKKALLQTVSYDHFFRQKEMKNDIPDGGIRSFLISSMTPAKRTLDKFGFAKSEWPGVFRSENVLLENIPLICLNDLSDEPHNAFFKVFASRTREKRVSLDLLMNNKAVLANTEIIWLLRGLAACWFQFKGDEMENELTPEKAMELGRRFEDLMISSIPLEKFFEKFGRDKIVSKLEIEDRLAGLSVEDIEAYLRKLKNKQK